MAEFTLLKIQLDESSFTANAPFSGSEEATVEAGEDADGDDDGGSGGGKLLPLLLVLVALAVVAVLAKRKLGGDGPGDDDLVELDDIDA